MRPGAPGRRVARRRSGRPRPGPRQWRPVTSPRRAAACAALLRRPRISCRWVELVAGAPHHLQVAGPARVALDLFAQAPNVDRDRGWTADEILVPDSVEQVIATEHLAGVGDEVVQQVEFLGSELDGLAADFETTVGWIELDFAAAQASVGGWLGVESDAAQLGFHSGDELAGAEGFDNIVVGADAQSADAVSFFAPCRKQDDGHGDMLLAQPFAHFEAVHPRQHDVEHDDVGWMLAIQRRLETL